MRSNSLLTSLLLVGCAGKAPGIQGDVDAPVVNPDSGPTVDGTVQDVGQKVSGKAYDYFTNLALDATTVATEGVSPALTSTTGTDGVFSLDHVPTGSKLFLSSTRTNYKTTRNVVTTVAGTPVVQDVYVASIARTNVQYTSVGLAPAIGVGKTALFIELRMNDGMPLVGIPVANIKLLDSANQPVIASGTYFFGPNGDLQDNATLATATAYVSPAGTPSRSRAAILGISPGTYTFSVTYTPAAGPPDVTMTYTVNAGADLVVLAQTGGMMTTTPPPTDPKFTTDIYPKLQSAAKGGLGCGDCHTAGGQGAVLQYDLPAAMVLANMKAAAGVIDLATPASSLLLVRPLYEQPPLPQDHPNATFIDVNDPDYKLFLLWITNGAKP